jgi:hypothetical protein
MKSRARFATNLFLWCLVNLRVFLVRTPSENLTIITASDSSHQLSLLNLLSSIRQFEPKAAVEIYDLGMEPSFAASLQNEFSSFRFKCFPYEKYPSYYNIKIDAGVYAWKPASLDESKPFNEFVLWLDAGNVLTGRLVFLRKVLKRFGFFSPYSIGEIKDWTHPQTLINLRIENNLLKSKNLSANVVGFNSGDRKSLDLIDSWIEAAKDKNLIAPPGSSRSNHRQDQSLLTVLAYQAGLVRYRNLGEFPRRIFKILVHQDVD